MSLYGWLRKAHRDRDEPVRLGVAAELSAQLARRRQGSSPSATRRTPSTTCSAPRIESDFRQVDRRPGRRLPRRHRRREHGDAGIYDRKGFGDMAAALGVFMDEHPDAYVYVHTIQDGRRA
jgi:hypothetical protein